MWLQTKRQTSKQTQLRKPVFVKILILSIRKCTQKALSPAVGGTSTAVQQLSTELLGLRAHETFQTSGFTDPINKFHVEF